MGHIRTTHLGGKAHYPRRERMRVNSTGTVQRYSQLLSLLVLVGFTTFVEAGWPTGKQERKPTPPETHSKRSALGGCGISSFGALGEESEIGYLWDLPAWYNKVTAEGVRDAARLYLNTQRYVKVVLVPEKK